MVAHTGSNSFIRNRISNSKRRNISRTCICIPFGMKMRDKLSKLGKIFKRINQVILVLPLWLVLGASGILQSFSKSEGWEDSQKNDEHERMY